MCPFPATPSPKPQDVFTKEAHTMKDERRHITLTYLELITQRMLTKQEIKKPSYTIFRVKWKNLSEYAKQECPP